MELIKPASPSRFQPSVEKPEEIPSPLAVGGAFLPKSAADLQKESDVNLPNRFFNTTARTSPNLVQRRTGLAVKTA
jgi:hypothetical protein